MFAVELGVDLRAKDPAEHFQLTLTLGNSSIGSVPRVFFCRSQRCRIVPFLNTIDLYGAGSLGFEEALISRLLFVHIPRGVHHGP